MRHIITKYKCPNCHKVLEKTFDMIRYGIGEPGTFECNYCNQPINNGLREWATFSKNEKSKTYSKLFIGNTFFFITLPLILSIFIIIFIGYIDTYLNLINSMVSVVIISLFSGVIISCLMFYFFMFKPLKKVISQSIKRTEIT